MEGMLQTVLKELQLREDHFYAMISWKPLHCKRLAGKDNQAKGTTANGLFTKQEHGNYAFCLGKHAHKNCQRVKDPKEHKRVLFLNLLDVFNV